MASMEDMARIAEENRLNGTTSLDIAMRYKTDAQLFPFNAFGHNEDTGTDWSDLWSGGSDYEEMTVASTLYVVSNTTTNNQDINIMGLDANYMIATATATLNGVTPVQIGSISSWIGVINRCSNKGSTDISGRCFVVNTSGVSGGVPNTTSSIKATIENGFNQTLQTIKQVPASVTAYIDNIYFSIGKGKDMEAELQVKPFGGVWTTKHHIDIYQNTYSHIFKNPDPISGKSIIKIRAKTSVGTTEVSGGFDSMGVFD